MENDDISELESETQSVLDTENLSEFITPPQKVPIASDKPVNSQPQVQKETPPKPGQKYWLSTEAKKKKCQYMKEYNERKKQEFEILKQHQLQPRQLTLLNINGKVSTRHLNTDADYAKLIEDLVGALFDNKLLSNYQLSEI